jgi:hypothetical protein
MANHYDKHTYTDIGTLLLNTYEVFFLPYERAHPEVGLPLQGVRLVTCMDHSGCLHQLNRVWTARLFTPGCEIRYMYHHTGCHQFNLVLTHNNYIVVKSANPTRGTSTPTPACARCAS